MAIHHVIAKFQATPGSCTMSELSQIISFTNTLDAKLQKYIQGSGNHPADGEIAAMGASANEVLVNHEKRTCKEY